MTTKVIPVIEGGYTSTRKVFGEYNDLREKCKRSLYNDISFGSVGGCFKIKKKILINEMRFMETLKNPEAEYTDSEKYRKEVLEILGERCSVKDISEFFGVSFGFVNNIVKKNEEELEIIREKSRRGKKARTLKTRKFLEFVKDIDE